MKIVKIVGNMHQEMVVPWYAKAINSEICNRLQVSCWNGTNYSQADGWNSVHYMDDKQTTLLNINIDRAAKTCGIGLWSLPGNEHTVGLMFRFMAKRMIIENNLGDHDYTFVIAEFNRKWLVMMLRFLKKNTMSECMWGVEPKSAYNTQDGTWYSLYHFRIPAMDVAQIFRGDA